MDISRGGRQWPSATKATRRLHLAVEETVACMIALFVCLYTGMVSKPLHSLD